MMMLEIYVTSIYNSILFLENKIFLTLWDRYYKMNRIGKMDDSQNRMISIYTALVFNISNNTNGKL